MLLESNKLNPLGKSQLNEPRYLKNTTVRNFKNSISTFSMNNHSQRSARYAIRDAWFLFSICVNRCGKS